MKNVLLFFGYFYPSSSGVSSLSASASLFASPSPSSAFLLCFPFPLLPAPSYSLSISSSTSFFSSLPPHPANPTFYSSSFLLGFLLPPPPTYSSISISASPYPLPHFLLFLLLPLLLVTKYKFFSELLRFCYHMHQNSMEFHLIPHMTY